MFLWSRLWFNWTHMSVSRARVSLIAQRDEASAASAGGGGGRARARASPKRVPPPPRSLSQPKVIGPPSRRPPTLSQPSTARYATTDPPSRAPSDPGKRATRHAHTPRALSRSLSRALSLSPRAPPCRPPPPRHPTSTRPHRLTPLAPRARLAALAARRAREGGSTTALPLPVFFSLPPPAAPPGACAPRPSLALLIAIHFLPPPLQPARSLPLPSTKHPHAPNTPRALFAAAADDDPIRRQRDSPWLHLSSSLARPYSFVSPMVP